MVGKFFLAAASLLSLASFSAAKCGVEHTPRDLLALHAKLQVEERNTPAVTKRDTLTVDLYMHAVESANATGSITNDQISQQVCRPAFQLSMESQENLTFSKGLYSPTAVQSLWYSIQLDPASHTHGQRHLGSFSTRSGCKGNENRSS